jgi:hypothetical protein
MKIYFRYTLLLLLTKRSIFDIRYIISLIIIAIVSERLGRGGGGWGALTIAGTLTEVFIRNREEGYHEPQDKWFTYSIVDVAVCTEFFAPDHNLIQPEQKPFTAILKGQKPDISTKTTHEPSLFPLDRTSKGTVSRDRYFFESLNIFISILCVVMVFKVF